MSCFLLVENKKGKTLPAGDVLPLMGELVFNGYVRLTPVNGK
jgi:hypothetical protein